MYKKKLRANKRAKRDVYKFCAKEVCASERAIHSIEFLEFVCVVCERLIHLQVFIMFAKSNEV